MKKENVKEIPVFLFCCQEQVLGAVKKDIFLSIMSNNLSLPILLPRSLSKNVFSEDELLQNIIDEEMEKLINSISSRKISDHSFPCILIDEEMEKSINSISSRKISGIKNVKNTGKHKKPFYQKSRW